MRFAKKIIFSLLISLWLFGNNSSSYPLQYKIYVKLDAQKKKLYGSEKIYWENLSSEPVKEMYFHLYWNAFKNSDSTFIQEAYEEGVLSRARLKKGEWGWIEVKSIKTSDGTDLTPTIKFVHPDRPLRPGDRTVMKVELPEPVKPGESVELSIDFEAKIPRSIVRTGYYRNTFFIAQWFPKPGVYEKGKGWNCHEYHLRSEFFADFADFKVTIDVPRGFVVGASGKLVDHKIKGDRELYTFSQRKIHDFAWTAAPDYIKVERDFIPEEEVFQKEYIKVSRLLDLPAKDLLLKKVHMILLIRPEHRHLIERHFKALKNAIKYYGLFFGAYPYETITLVDPPFGNRCGGMEYPTLITAGSPLFTPKEILSPEGVIIHEFGHQFWYGMVANNEFEEAWLDEGINTYCTGKVLEKAYGKGVLTAYLNRIPLNRYFKIKYYDFQLFRAGALEVATLDPIVTKSWKFYSAMSYGANVYSRAALALSTLERMLGEGKLLRILREFQQRFRFRHPTTKDFIKTANEVASKDLSWFFQEFFYSAKELDYGIDEIRCFTEPGKKGVYEQKGKKVEIWPSDKKEKKKYRCIVKVRRYGDAVLDGDAKLKVLIRFEDGREVVKYWDGRSRWVKYRFSRSPKVEYAVVDPDRIYLMDANLTNNSRKLRRSRAGIFRWTAAALTWLETLLLTLFSIS